MTKTEYIAAIEADLTAANNLCAECRMECGLPLAGGRRYEPRLKKQYLSKRHKECPLQKVDGTFLQAQEEFGESETHACEFCEKYNFGNAGLRLSHGKDLPSIYFPGLVGNVPEGERFKFCPVCGRALTEQNFK